MEKQNHYMYSVSKTSINPKPVEDPEPENETEFTDICSTVWYVYDVHSRVTTDSSSPIYLHINANIRLLHGSGQMH